MGDRCFCIFEGGGAKGIAHVGALAALEESGLGLCGFAGTSAGAVIAALAAAGYRAADLLAEDRTILDLVDLDRTNIWAGDAFDPARTPARLFGRVGWAGIVVARSVGIYALLGFALVALLAASLLGLWLTLAPAMLVILQCAGIALVVVAASFVSFGLASLATFERGFNQLLRLRLAGRLSPAAAHRARSPEPVTFADLDRAGCPPLKIVAADISTRELRLFSARTTPEVSVASAVAASVCLPVVFRPWRIGGRLHLDGGLVSNLPAWVFDAERAIDRDAWTAVIQVGDATKEERLWGVGILKGAILTGIFGSGVLNVRNVDRLASVRLKVALKLLQFDPGLEIARRIAKDAQIECAQRLVYRLNDLPALMTSVCERIRIRAERSLGVARRLEDKPPFAGIVRVSIFVRPPDDPMSLLAEFQTGFGFATDERIRLPLDGSIVGQSFQTNQPLYLERSDPAWATYLSRVHERWPRKLIWPDLQWVLCVPFIRAVDGIELVATIDSDTYLDVADDLVDVTLSSLVDAVVRMLSEFVPKEAFARVSS